MEQEKQGIVIEKYDSKEVALIALDFAENKLYKLPASDFANRFKPGDNVIFSVAPGSNVIVHCRKNENFFANNSSLQIDEDRITMCDTVYFSDESDPRVYSLIVGYLNFEKDRWANVMPNVPYKAILEMNIIYGNVATVADLKLDTFNPSVEFWISKILSVDMQEIATVHLMEWNRTAKNSFMTISPEIIDEEDPDEVIPMEIKVKDNTRQIKKVRKDTCIVLEPDLFYSSDGSIINNPLPGSYEIGTYAQVTYYRCRFNKVRIAGKVNALGEIPIRKINIGYEFKMKLSHRRYGFYSNEFVPIISDPKGLLSRVDTESSPKYAWVRYHSDGDLFSRFTVADVPQETETKIASNLLNFVESFGFVKDTDGKVYCPDHFDIQFCLSKSLMAKHKLGDCIQFNAELRPNQNCFVITATSPGSRYVRLTVGIAQATAGAQSYAFQVPLGRVSRNMLKNETVGLVEDPSGKVCQILSAGAPTELAERTFWIAFDTTGIVPLRIITEYDGVSVKPITDNVMLYLELPEDYYESDEDIQKNPMLEKLFQLFG